MTEQRFTAELWQWDARKSDGWFFVTLPHDLADDIEAQHGHRAAGFGSVRVEVTVGATTWQTSIFPDSKAQSYVLPVKRQVRVKESLGPGTPVNVTLRVIA